MENIVFIILPVYNGEKYLLQQLMSIYFQDYKNWHLVIINDGSTDSTKQIINKFILDYKLEKKITIINQNNHGLNKSIENGLIKVQQIIKISGIKGAYVTYCDADDLMMTNRLSYQVNFMKTHKECDLSYHDLILIDENNAIINLSYFNKLNKNPLINTKCNKIYELCFSNHIPATTIMFNGDKINFLYPFPKIMPFQDWWTSLVFSANEFNIMNMGIALGYYRRYTNQMSDSSKKINLSWWFKNLIESLTNLKMNIKNENTIKIINEFLRYYRNRLTWTTNNKGAIQQMIRILFYNPQIIIYKIKSYFKKT